MNNKYNLVWPLIAIGAIIFGVSMNKVKDRKVSNTKFSLETKITKDTSIFNKALKKPSFICSPQALKRFDAWIDSTLEESAKDSTNSIIVDKTDYTLYLIKNGKVDSQYNIELGFNSFDDKQRQGDGCTPEGMYKVQRKLPPGTTSFYKAFLINYPTKEQRLEGKTGGLIEIHGSGSGNKGNGSGYNWTLGCMATSNENIDKIFPYIEEGDRVTIVRYTTKDLGSKNQALR